MKNLENLVHNFKEQNYTKLPKFFFPETLFPLKGDRGGLGTLWNRRRLLERPQGYFVLFVGRRYYLRPIILWNALRPLEQSLGYTWNARRGLVKSHYYTRATHGIVEVMWSNRGAFVERGFLSRFPENL